MAETDGNFFVAEFSAEDIDSALKSAAVTSSPAELHCDSSTHLRANLSGLQVTVKILPTNIFTKSSVVLQPDCVTGISPASTKDARGKDTQAEFATKTASTSSIPAASLAAASDSFPAAAAAAVNFKSYVRLLSGLNHESLLPLLGVCYERRALVFPFVEGGNLVQRLRSAGPDGSSSLPWLGRLGIACDVAEALWWLHEHGLKHGNLKPANLLIDSYDAVQVADISPRQQQQQRPLSIGDRADDVYALGNILLLLLTGYEDEQTHDRVQLTCAIQNAAESKGESDPEAAAAAVLTILRPHLDQSAAWPDNQAAAIARLAAACRRQEPEPRPTLSGDICPLLISMYNAALGAEPAAAIAAEDLGSFVSNASQAANSAAAGTLGDKATTRKATLMRAKSWARPPFPGAPSLASAPSAPATEHDASTNRLQRLYTQQKQLSLRKQYSFQRQSSFYEQYGSKNSMPTFKRQISRLFSHSRSLKHGYTPLAAQADGAVGQYNSSAVRHPAAYGSTLSTVKKKVSSSSTTTSDDSPKSSSAASSAQSPCLTAASYGSSSSRSGSSACSSTLKHTAEIAALEAELFSFDPDIQSHAICHVSNRAYDSETFGIAMAADMLHKLATCSSEHEQMVAAAVVADLAQLNLVSTAMIQSMPEVYVRIAHMLNSSDEQMQYAAAGALGALAACSPDNQAAFAAQAGVAERLIALLDSSDEGIQELAALALGNLVRQQPDCQDFVGSQPGAISHLAWMLYSDNEGLQEVAALALGNLAAGCPGNQAAIDAIPGVYAQLALRLDSSSSENVRQQAAFAIGAIADANPGNQADIVAAVPEIFELLAALMSSTAAGSSSSSSSSSEESQDTAVCALGQLIAHSPANQAAMLAIVPDIICQLVSLLSSSNADVQLRCIMLLGVLAENNPSTQAVMSATPVVFPKMAVLLGSSNDSIQQHAAFAVAILSCNNAYNQAAFAAVPDALGQLAKMLQCSNEAVQQSAACAIWSLASDNADNQAAFSELPDIFVDLARLLGSSTEDVQAHAVRALYELTANSPENQAAAAAVPGIFRQLAAVLTSENDIIRMLAALALCSLASGSPGNKMAVASVPGIFNELVLMLSSKNEAPQDAAAGLLQCLVQCTDGAANCHAAATAAAAAGMVPDVYRRLADLLDSSNTEVQAAAAAVLHTLAVGDAAVKAAIGSVAGIWQKIAGMLNNDDEKMQICAAQLISELTDDNLNKAAKVGSINGVFHRLAVLMESSEPAVQYAASNAVESLASFDCNRSAITAVHGLPTRLVSMRVYNKSRGVSNSVIVTLSGKGFVQGRVSKGKKGLGGLVGQVKGALKGIKL